MQLGRRQDVFYSPVNDLVAAIVGCENRLTAIVEASDGISTGVVIGALAVSGISLWDRG
jgi:hypothetical protein